jgi:hypothetical protein
MDNHKLGIIVPFRNRHEHLFDFTRVVKNYLSNLDMNYEIIIVEQDNAKLFNRGMLLNIGFKYAEKMKCDYVVFHDVDMLPIDVDYSYSPTPLHLATDFVLKKKETPREMFEQYFGGVTLFPVEIFKKIDGYSNKYWGWGYEDTDLLYRCEKNNIDLNTLRLINVGNNGTALKFNGVDSFVECKNTIDLSSNLTIFTSFHPDKLLMDHTVDSDTYTIFSIPGWDFSISFNSFSRYNFCTFDKESNVLYVNSKIKPNYKTNFCVTINREVNIIKVYQDGNIIGEINGFNDLYEPYNDERYFYLGVGNPKRNGDPNFFRGTIDRFAYFNSVLSDDEVVNISNNYDNISNIDSLKIHYDTNKIENYQLVDLTNGGNNGNIVKCEIIQENVPAFNDVKIPHRRNGIFSSLKHEENGFLNNKWKDQATRWNQLRFVNEVLNNDELLLNDGLSTLEFIEHGKTKTNNITHINVGV